MNLEAVVGLEIHVQLKTESKMFCRCNNASEGAAPNTLICPICTGHPGTLPLPNQQAIRWAVMAAQALGCTVPQHAKFDRKHYSYPDLPKGYQISQYDEPIGLRGALSLHLDAQPRTISLTRLHLEEDVGKLLHVGKDTLIDFNRAGTPLVEIVTEPDIRTPAEAKAFLQELRLIMRFLGVSNADMEKGELRCDANVSLRPVGSQELHPKTEIKNLNSFRSVERALRYEIDRQRQLWQAEKRPPHQETRGWDEAKQETMLQRTKEAAADYRYFPEPDIPPLHFTPEFLVEVKAETPELPAARRHRLVELYGLTTELSSRLIEDRELVTYFEEVVSEIREYRQASLGAQASEQHWEQEKAAISQTAATWLLNRISREHRGAHHLPVTAENLGRLLWMLHEKSITLHSATVVYEKMVQNAKKGGHEGPHTIIEEMGLARVSDATVVDPIVQQVIMANPKQAEQYRQGKTAVLQFLIGQVMRQTKGRADAEAVRQALERALKSN
jgi:aspartyl-tRNA(Asn)/glutamyl-tRNA(Gln) amidotransferase subunit B